MQADIHLLYPVGYDRSQKARMKDYKFIHSLKIDDMVVLVKESHRGFRNLLLEDFFTADPEVLEYRLSVVEDLVENPQLYEIFCRSISTIHNIYDLCRSMSSDFTVESALGSIRYLEMYQEIVNLFADGLRDIPLHSEGMMAFREQILAIEGSDDYQNLSNELPKAENSFGFIKGLTIGVNLDVMGRN